MYYAKAPLQVKYTVQGVGSSGKDSTRRSCVLYLYETPPRVLYFPMHYEYTVL